MPTNTAALQIDSLKSQTAPSAIKTGIVVLCMIGLVAGLVLLLSSITGAPDVSNIGQLVGP
jgi:MFS superfamily sulfate permease-like transporter